MDAELTRLAVSGATVLVQQMVGDGWAQVRDRLARCLSRGGAAAGEGAALLALRGELDTSRAELLAARDAGDEDAVADVRAEWRSRLRRALRADPRLAAELGAMVEELGSQGRRGDTYNTINGGEYDGTVIQAGTIGYLHPAPHRDRPRGE
jgi:hypothetical protein